MTTRAPGSMASGGPARRRGAWPRLAAVAVGAVLLLGACSSDGGSDAATTDDGPTTEAPAESTTTTEVDDTPTTDGGGSGLGDCPDPDDVAEVVGEPVDQSLSGGGRASTSGVSFSYQGCSYDLDGGGSVGVDRVTVAEESDDGRPVFDQLEESARVGGSPGGRGLTVLEGLGEAAYRDDDEEVAVLQGSRMVFVELEPADDAPDDASTVMAQAEAVGAALLELDLTVDVAELCPGVEGAVAEAIGPVTGSDEQVGGKAVNDVSFETVGCVVELDDGSEVEVDVADSVDWDAWVAAEGGPVEASPFTGLSIGERAAFDTGEELVVDDGEQPLRISTEDLELDAEAAAELRLALAELALDGPPD